MSLLEVAMTIGASVAIRIFPDFLRVFVARRLAGLLPRLRVLSQVLVQHGLARNLAWICLGEVLSREVRGVVRVVEVNVEQTNAAAPGLTPE
jgi:hypothetical protein